MAVRHVQIPELFEADSLECSYKKHCEIPDECYVCGRAVGSQGDIPSYHCIRCGRVWIGKTLQQAAYLFFKIKEQQWEIRPVEEDTLISDCVGEIAFGRTKRKKKKPLACRYCATTEKQDPDMFPGPPFPVCSKCKGLKASEAMKRRDLPEEEKVFSV